MDVANRTVQRDERRYAQQELAKAAEMLAARGRLALAPLLDTYRRLAPISHPGANHSLPDLAFLQHAHEFANLSLAGAKHWLVTTHHARTETQFQSSHSPGVLQIDCANTFAALADLMTLALGVCLEADKLRRLLQGIDVEKDGIAWLCSALQCDPTSLLVALGGPSSENSDDVSLIARWVQQGNDLVLHRVDTTSIAVAERPATDEGFLGQSQGPLFLIAGATERVHDLLSPYLRRLQEPLRHLCAEEDDDSSYTALSLLYQAEPRAHDERMDLEVEDGFFPAENALLISCTKLNATHVDPRVKRTVQKLKQARCRIVLCTPSSERLAAALRAWGHQVRCVVLLNEGFHAQQAYTFPEMLEDVATGHLLPLHDRWPNLPDTARTHVSLSAPSLGLALETSPCTNTSLFALATECYRAKSEGHLDGKTPIHAAISRVDAPETFTQLSLTVLESFAHSLEQAPSRQPSPLWQRQFLR